MKKVQSPAPARAAEVRLEFAMHAPQREVWSALVNDTPSWWPKSFHTSERTQRFVIEPRLGGMVGEITGRREGLTWYRVIGIEAPNWLLLAGYLLPPWAGPATSLLRITLTPVGPGETNLELTDSTFGVVGDTSSTADGWRQIFDQHLRKYVEKPTSRRRRTTKTRP